MPTTTSNNPTAVTHQEMRWIRRRFGLSLNEAAKILKTTRHYLVLIENGQRPCYVKYALLYERAMGKEWFKAMRLEYAAEQAELRSRYGDAKKEDESKEEGDDE